VSTPAASLAGDRAERYAFPASFAQQRLWFIEQLERTGAAWNVRLPVRLKGPLDAALLGEALALVVDRHESLRTTLGMRHGEIVQFVASRMEVPLVQVPLPGGPGDAEARLRDLLGQLASEPFDLATGPLLRACLVPLGPDDHALLLLAHHVVSDAWSSGVLFRDLADAYAARARGGAPAWLPLPVQYADFAVWQREWLAGPELERQVAWWRDHLEGAPVLLDLPLDHPRPRLQGYRGTRTGHALTPELTVALKQLAVREGVTPFMLLFAAFNLLLGRWSGQRDLVIGTPIAGRRRTELEGLVGFFANTLALRTRLEPRQSFRQLLRAVRATALEAFEHQDLPFEKLVEVLRPPRSLAHSPLFQVLFALQNVPWEAGRFGDLAVAPAEIAPGTATRFDLSVSATEFEGRLWLGLEYSTDLFEADTIARLATGFETLLAAVVADPAADLSLLPVEHPADRERQLRDWQGPVAPVPDLADLLAAGARATPEVIAVECGDERLCYADLAVRVRAISAALSARGFDPAVPVALCLPRSIDLLASLLAVLDAGGYYLPLDPSQPPARLATLLRDSGARHVIVAGSTAGRVAGFDGIVLDAGVLAGGSGGEVSLRSLSRSLQDTSPPLPPASTPATPAYLIYTSGSTGQPKGVLVPRPAVANFLASMAREPGLRAGDRLLAVTTLSFDIAVLELLLPLTVGATVVIAPEEDVRDPARLAALIDDAGITVLQATPSLWRNLVSAGWPGRAGLRLLCGGEALDRELADQLLARGEGLWNLYGPTETTVWSTVARVGPGTGPVDVGRPVANTRCYVLDEALEPVPAGVRGELWIGGAGVALGYAGQPELTAGRFVPDPFAPPGEAARLYRTGDRARWRADGHLEVLGRTDFQLKLRGFRVEPGEIEAVLLAQPGIAAAVLVLREVAGDPRLVAYVVPAGDGPDDDGPGDDALLAVLRDRLPAWMVPSHVVRLTALPLTPNGKVDRAALPAPAPGAPAGPAAPATAAEQALLRIFRELLGVSVGPDEDFFARGGHSLLATRLVARVAAELGATLPLRAVFEAPTARALAGRLPATLPVVAAVIRRAAAPGEGVAEVAPLSVVQQRLWFLDRLQPGNPAYHLAWAFTLAGDLDRAALKAALDGLAARHGSLRTRFAERDGEPVQVVEPPAGLPLAALAAPAEQVPALAGDFAARTFNLADGPPARTLLITSGPALHTLVLVIHHIVADGWSFGVLARELAALYAAARDARAPDLPGVACTYAEHAREQRRALAGGELARQLDWWRTALAGAPPFLDLPVDRPRPAVASSRGARYSARLSADLLAGLHRLARTNDCTLFMVLLAAFDVLLARVAGTGDVVVGTPIAGRTRAEVEGVVGFFVNTLVLRIRLEGNPTVRELLARVRAQTLAAYEHADVPFEMLVEALQPPRSTARTPLFQVLFNLHSEPAEPLALPGLTVTPCTIPRQSAKFDLSVSLTETAAGLAVTVEYASDLFLAGTIARLLDDYAGLLAAFVAGPASRLSALPFSATPRGLAVRAVAGPRDLLAAVAGQVASRADALAVSAPATDRAPAEDFSYGSLAAGAGAIAAALAARGVRPGDRVGLWFGHGAGQVAGMLGVLAAGAAFVPLDPLAPPARLARIIADAGLGWVVTERSAPAWPEGLADGHLTRLERDTLPPAPFRPVPVAPDAPAYLLYTSGTTGTPKGVAQTRANVLGFVRAWAANLGLGPDDRLSLLSTYGYDAAVQDIFGALVTGASVCPLDIRRLDRETLLDRIADRGLTVLHGTPTAYRYLFGGHVACRQDLSRVRAVVLGGERARRADFELFRSRFRRGAVFVNGYGLTEATAVTQWFADHDTQPRGLDLPIGRPLPGGGLRVRLLDEAGESAPFVGEVVIEGEGVPRFHTGDLARYDPDGELVFVGRRDHRLKIGGIRLEPAEIEAALREVPGVAEAVVAAAEEVPGEPVLVAWYTATADVPAPGVASLRAALAAHLPAAFVPARWQRCDSLPRLPNGKVDRRAVAEASGRAGPGGVSRSERDSERRDTPPGPALPDASTEIEATLQDIWQALLKRPAVGLDEDFFLLGGHSLLATRLVARVRDRLGVELPLIRVFEAPTVRGLARFLGDGAPGESGSASRTIYPPWEPPTG